MSEIDKLKRLVDFGAGKEPWAEVDDDGSISVFFNDPKGLGLASWNFSAKGQIVVSLTMEPAFAFDLAALSTPEPKTPDVEAVAWQVHGKGWGKMFHNRKSAEIMHEDNKGSVLTPLYPDSAIDQLRRERDELREAVEKLLAAGKQDLILLAETAGTMISLRTRAEKAEAAVAVMREALKPFARVADIEDFSAVATGATGTTVTLNIELCRKARSALSHEPNGGGE